MPSGIQETAGRKLIGITYALQADSRFLAEHRVLGILLFVAGIAMTLPGQVEKPLFGLAATTAAGVAVLPGLSIATDVRGSVHWRGQHAKDDASLFFNGAARDSGVYRNVGVGFAVLLALASGADNVSRVTGR